MAEETGRPASGSVFEFIQQQYRSQRSLHPGTIQNCSDIVFRSFPLKDETVLLLVYLEGMTRLQSIEDNILRPLLFGGLPQGWIVCNRSPKCSDANGFRWRT